jgi:hypothetical protein
VARLTRYPIPRPLFRPTRRVRIYLPLPVGGGGGPGPAFAGLTSGGSATAGTTRTTASVTPTANRLILIAINAYVSAGSVNPTITSVVGNGITYELVGTSQDVDTAGTDRTTMFVYRGMSAAPSAGTILITFGISVNSVTWSVVQSDANVDTSGTNGSGAIVASAGSVSASTVTTQPTSFSPAMTPGNSGYFACAIQNTDTQTARAGWTELHNVTTIVTAALETQYIAATDTAGSSTWTNLSRAGSIVVEVLAAAGAAAPPVPLVAPSLAATQASNF